jgi:hypothetical protein
MADEKKKDGDDGPVTFRHFRDGREVTYPASYTRLIAEADEHPNWKRA